MECWNSVYPVRNSVPLEPLTGFTSLRLTFLNLSAPLKTES